MNKAEAKELLKQKSDEGYVTHSMLLNLYDDDEEIPEDMMPLLYHKPEPPKPYQFTFYCGIDMAEEMEKTFKDFYPEK